MTNYQNILLLSVISLLVFSAGLQAKFSSKSSARIQTRRHRVCVRLQKTMQQIALTYQAELTILSEPVTSQVQKLTLKNIMLLKHTSLKYPLVKYQYQISAAITSLNKFKNQYPWLDLAITNHLTQILNALNQIENFLSKDCDYLVQLQKFNKDRRALTVGIIGTLILLELYALGCASIIMMFSGYSTEAILGTCAGTITASIYLDIKVADKLKKQRVNLETINSMLDLSSCLASCYQLIKA